MTPPLPEPTAPDPVSAFDEWYAHADSSGLLLPEAMALATATVDGRPSVRMALFKGLDDRGLRFYTNYRSRKARELAANPRAATCFHWAALSRQVRVCGTVEKLAREASEAYFRSRPRGSRIGAWASLQSASYRDRSELDERVREMERRFGDGDIPLPPYWGGYRLVPDEIEFWMGRSDRLHDRVVFRRLGLGPWTGSKLHP